MRVGFLLGSGVSLPAGMPCTRQITQEILERTGSYTHHTDGSFIKQDSVEGIELGPKMDKVASILKFINGLCDNYFVSEELSKRAINYEDVFYAASQLSEHLSREYENPSLEPLVHSALLFLPGVTTRDELKELAETTCRFICDVVTAQLSGTAQLGTCLQCLICAVSDQRLDGCDVFTLNHDRVIETALLNSGAHLVDGFGTTDGDVAWWEPTIFENRSRHYFLKLHGSIDWFQFDRGVAKMVGTDPDHACTATGSMLPMPARSRVLVGTFNKIRDYFEVPYSDLIVAFRRQIRTISVLIVSGYSFGDKGVNAVLNDWLRSSPETRMLVLHQGGKAFLAGARGAIRKLLDDLGGGPQDPNGRMLVHPQHLNDCSWDDLCKRYNLVS